MKSYKLILASLALGLGVTATSCRDDFSEINQNPAAVTKGDVSFLFAEAVNNFDPQPYLEYYYNAPMKYAWAGFGISPNGASESILTLTADGDQSRKYISVLRTLRAMQNEISLLDETAQPGAQGYYNAANVMAIYMGIFATDMYGSIPFTEACTAAYPGGTLTPKLDSVEDLYNTWLTQLDDAIASFTSGNVTIKSEQDVVYGGDLAKWAKFANSLKLRIAVRLLAQDPTKAKSIAAEVEGAACGYIAEVSEDVRFGKGETRLTGDQGPVNDLIYHWSNGFTAMAGSESIINLMLENKDPRVRFFYTKNSWNSKIVQGYYDAGLEIPEQIEKNVVSEVGADGKKKFVKWGGMGEPWVRYVGLTEEWMAKDDATGAYKWFFPTSYGNADKELYLHNKDGENATGYTLYSSFNNMMIIGRQYTAASQVSAATLPDDTYTFTSNDRPWTGLYMSAAEVHLYLAEFAMLANNEAKAKEHYDKALACSVTTYDLLSEANQVAYRASVKGCFGYDSNEAAIDLKEGEIEAMMEGDEYAFTGTAAEKLEKIYVQQLLNFTLYPNEVFVTARRSGYPAFDSTILPRKAYAAIAANAIPRRFPTGTITDKELMGANLREAYAEQGLTETASGMYKIELATERLWADHGAPTWGTPNM